MAKETVNVTVKKSGLPLVLLEGVRATLLRSDSGAILGSGLTNAQGVVVFDGTVIPGWAILDLSKKGYRPTYPKMEFGVPNTNGATPLSVTYTMDDLSINPPSSVQLCTVYGTMRGEAKMVVEIVGSEDRAWLDPTTKGSTIDPSGVLGVTDKWEVVPDANGYWSVDLPVGAYVRFSVLAAGLSRTFRVPTTFKSVDLKDTRVWLQAVLESEKHQMAVKMSDIGESFVGILNSRKGLVLVAAVIGVIVLNVLHRISGDQALDFLKWIVGFWMGGVAIEDAAKKRGASSVAVGTVENQTVVTSDTSAPATGDPGVTPVPGSHT